MFGLQISQNIGCDPQWGVRKKDNTHKKTSSGEVMMMMTIVISPRPFGKEQCLGGDNQKF